MRKRTISILFRLNEQENQFFREQVAMSGYSAQEYMRRRLIEGQTMKPRPAGEMAEIRRELSAIGNNINQIAHWANAKKSMQEAEIRQAVLLANKAWDLVKEIL